jgi:hypothetical protein
MAQTLVDSLVTGYTPSKRESEVFQALDDRDFGYLENRLVGPGKDFNTPSQYQEALGEYKKFLAIAVTTEGDIGMISHKVDSVWHENILFTQEYHEMSQQINSGYLHHEPNLEDSSNVLAYCSSKGTGDDNNTPKPITPESQRMNLEAVCSTDPTTGLPSANTTYSAGESAACKSYCGRLPSDVPICKPKCRKKTDEQTQAPAYAETTHISQSKGEAYAHCGIIQPSPGDIPVCRPKCRKRTSSSPDDSVANFREAYSTLFGDLPKVWNV